MAGRNRKPTKLKVLNGNPGRRRLPKREPKPKAGIPKPPARIAENLIALAVWEEFAAELDAMQVLTLADRAALAALVSAYCEYIKADDAIEEHGLTQTRETQGGDSYEAARPEVAIRSDSWKRYKSMLIEFGLTPSSRTRISTNLSPKKNRLADFLESG